VTTQQGISIALHAQRKVIAALRAIDESELAGRLECCMTAHCDGDGRLRACRSAGCVWCRPPLIQSWWTGIRDWAAPATSSLAIIVLRSPTGLRNAVQRLRRALRDVRDRTARSRNQWRTVCFAGMVGGDGKALILIEHEGVDRQELLAVLQRRWPEVVLKNLDNEAPTSTVTADNAADLARFRRGVEPLRIVVLPQCD
jgi:hypothetical protein